MSRRRYGYSRRPRYTTRYKTRYRTRYRYSRRGRGGNPIVALVALGAIFLLPVLFVALSVFIFLLPFLLIAGIVWLIVKFVRRMDSIEENPPESDFTATTIHPTTNTQSPPVSQFSTLTTTIDGTTAIPIEAILPQRNYFKINESAINYYWGEAFYRNLECFTGGSIIHTDGRHGLIYYYIVEGQVRYIGQTRENTLKWRMNKPQAALATISTSSAISFRQLPKPG